jgi:hypothetical protein
MISARHSVVLALGIALLGGCGGRAGTSPASPAPSATPLSAQFPTTEPVHIETNSSGDKYITVVQRVPDGRAQRTRIVYRLRAVSSQADIVGAQSVASFEEPHITFLDRMGKQLIADSPQAKITQHDKSVVMGGGVHARAEDGSVLTCDTLRYDGRTEKLHGQGHVVLSGPNQLTLTGEYLEGDVRLDHVRVAEHPL